eukprot:3873839-Alexandrium_andersonii.AAC.1
MEPKRPSVCTRRLAKRGEVRGYVPPYRLPVCGWTEVTLRSGEEQRATRKELSLGAGMRESRKG